jgi:uroporphyrinogen decarboxylase
MTLPTDHPLVLGKTSSSPMVLALNGIRQKTPPVWFMRQAGRSLPEYKKVREGIAMLDSCLKPELAAEITLQPVRRHGVDAAVFFSDIVIPLKLSGVEVEIVSGVGPVLDHPIQSRKDFEALQEISREGLTNEALEPICTAIKICTEELGSTPLLGFGGAPFTLASYLIEGKPSKELPISRRMMKEDPHLWADILRWCADVTAEFLRAQINAGASAIQLFDSWAGRLSHGDYIEFAAPYSRRVFEAIGDLDVPRIHFGVGTAGILREMRSAGATVVGISNDLSLSKAVQLLGNDIPLQGNLDPEIMLRDWATIEKAADEVIAEGMSAQSHIFNLGHGVIPETNPESLTRLVEHIHEKV